MLEVMIERWSNRDGSTDYLWSLWHDGRRVQMGGKHKSAEESEQAARDYCAQALRRAPDRVTQL